MEKSIDNKYGTLHNSHMNLQKSLNDLQKIGLTQSFIALEIGCDQSTVSDISRGKSGNFRPSYKIVSGVQKLTKKHSKKISELAANEV